MPIDTSEKSFEAALEQALLAPPPVPKKDKKAGEGGDCLFPPGGYRKRRSG